MSEVLTERDGAVLTITLNRPDVFNAFMRIAKPMPSSSSASCIASSYSDARAFTSARNSS